MGVGEATQDKKRVETAAAEMQQISGQKPVITKAKKSIAQFKLREGMPRTTRTYVVSPDGGTMTETVVWLNLNGKPEITTSIFNRVR